MARSKWKFYFICRGLQRFLFFKKSRSKVKSLKKKIYSRSTIVPKGLTRNSVLIYKGNEFKQLYVTKRFTNYKFGEFAFTRKPFYYPIKDKNKKKKR
jgi:ribosomal protein S19